MPLNAMPRCSHIYASALDCSPASVQASNPEGQRSSLLPAPASHHRFGDSRRACDVPVMTVVAQVPAEQRKALPLVLYRRRLYFHLGVLPPEMAEGMSDHDRIIEACGGSKSWHQH